MINWSSLISRSSSILGFTRVSNISNIATVGISNIVVDSLCATIRQSYAVRAGGRITITTLIGLEVGTRVVIIDSILVLVDSRLVIGGRSMVRRCSMVGRDSIPWGIVCSGKSNSSKNDKDLHVYS